MLKKLMLVAFLLVICNVCMAQKAEKALPIVPVGEKVSLTKADSGYEDYCQARKSYHEALQVHDDVSQRTTAFNAAIQAINLATNKEAENPSYWLLGSQIYRARGGVGFAKNYFAKACAAYEKNLATDTEIVSHNLQYAIACYAGDAQFYADYSAYKNKAVKYAKAALKAIDELESNPENKKLAEFVGEDLLEQKFLAYFILHDDKKLGKLREQIKSSYKEPTPLAYLLADYEKLVLNGKWYWEVSDKESAEKMFLLYYLRDWSN